MSQDKTAETGIPDEQEFFSLKEIATKLNFSAETIRRHMKAGKLREIEWVDLLGNGKIRATRESVDRFIAHRISHTEKILSQSPGV